MKQLVGNQDRLPLHLQEKIKASPAKQTTAGEKKAAKRAAQARISSDSTYTYNALRNDPNSWMSKSGKGASDAAAEKAGRDARGREEKRSPMKQTTYGEIMHQKHVENMEKGKATKPVDKAKALWDAMISDVTYSDAKKEYRKKRKAEYEANHPESPAKACWDGYEMIGMKKKGGKNVPNCVPKKK